MRPIIKILFPLLLLVFVISCSSDDEINYPEKSSSLNQKVDENTVLKFTYHGKEYSSLLDFSESDALFLDPTVESIYREIIENPNVVISVKADNHWEIYDNENYCDQFSNFIETKSNAYPFDFLEPEIYQSATYLYEHENFGGRMLEWVGYRMFPYKRVGDIDEYYLSEFDFHKITSSLKIYNNSYSYRLHVSLVPDYGRRTISLNIEPRQSLILSSIRKTYGNAFDNQAVQVRWAYVPTPLKTYPPDNYMLTNIAYSSTGNDIQSVKDVVLYRKFVYGAVGEIRTVSLSGELTSSGVFNANFSTPMNLSIGYTQIPKVENNKVEFTNLSKEIWEFKLNNTYTKKIPVEKTQKVSLIGYGTPMGVNLLCKEYHITINYQAHFKHRKNGNIIIIDGKFDAIIQSDPYIQLGIIIVRD